MSNGELQLAILHDVTSRLKDTGKIPLQKLAYFLQEALGIPTKYRFRMHHYGPYAEALETNLSRLNFTGYIDIQPGSQGHGVHITSIDDPEEEWIKLLHPYRELIDRGIETFGSWSTPKLELAATIHFVNKLQPDTPAEGILARVKSLKPKLSESYIAQVHDELKRSGLLS